MPMVAQPLHELLEILKMDHSCSSGSGCATMVIPQLSQHDVPRDFTGFATAVEVEAEVEVH
jgi:hypothetical protein